VNGCGAGTADGLEWTTGAARAGILDRLVSALVRESLLDPARARSRGLAVPLRRATRTGRLVLDGPVVWDRGARARRMTDPADVLDAVVALGLLPHDVPPHDVPPRDGLIRGIRDEIAASVDGYAVALTHAAERAAAMRAAEPVHPGRPFSDLAARLEGSGSPFAGFEQLASIDGHPLHPMAKLRRGMAHADVVRYAPECRAEAPLRFVAALRDHTHGAAGTDRPARGGAGTVMSTVLGAAFPAAVAAAHGELAAAGHDPDRYLLLPVHPHQLDHALPRLWGEDFTRGDLVPLSPCVPARALMSTRTLAAREPGAPHGLHVKTALEVFILNSVRGVSLEDVHNGPRVSALLDRIAHRDPAVRPLEIQREVAGAGFARRCAEDDDRSAARSRSLGAVLREDIDTHLAADEVALPAAALTAASPLTGRPVLQDIVGELVGDGRAEDAAAVARTWFRRYVELLVPPALVLMSRYGVALELHLQNVVPVLRDRRPHRVFVRDFFYLRVDRSRLTEQGHSVDVVPEARFDAQRSEELWQVLYTTLFGHHLAEVVHALAPEPDAEAPLWEIVRETAGRAFAGLVRQACSDRQAAAIRSDATALLHSPWLTMAHLRMRLAAAPGSPSYVPGPNPLRQGPSAAPAHAGLPSPPC
jgi:siderophore synthetase component